MMMITMTTVLTIVLMTIDGNGDYCDEDDYTYFKHIIHYIVDHIGHDDMVMTGIHILEIITIMINGNDHDSSDDNDDDDCDEYLEGRRRISL